MRTELRWPVKRWGAFWVAISATAGVATLVTVALYRQQDPLNAQAGVRFVGSDGCLPCHKSIVEEFRATGHNKSLQKGSPQSLVFGRLGKQTAFVGLPERNYLYMLEEQGDELHFQARPTFVDTAVHTAKVEYVLGSGKRGQGFLAETGPKGDRKLLQLPISYYTVKKDWGLSPGQDAHLLSNPLKFREVRMECLRCHTTQPPRVNDEKTEGVSCESCHGPGGRHVDQWSTVREEVTRFTKADPTIVNPKRLSTERTTEICSTCHSKELKPLPGKSFAYRPGTPLDRYYQVAAGSPGEQHSEPESLAASACFRKSNGKLRCGSCHSTHGTDPGMAQYEMACMKCHQPEKCPQILSHGLKKPLAGCVSCHMPQTEPWTHASFRDHRIRRQP